MIATALTVAAGASAVLAIAADWEERRHRAFFLLKPLTTLLVIGIAATGPLEDAYTRWVLAALALSLCGDVFLMSGDDRAFLGGLASFLLAHVAFVGAFMQDLPAPALPGWLAAVAFYAVALMFVVLPRAGPLKLPVLAYGLVLAAMVFAAAARHASLGGAGALGALLGALLFLASDSLLACRRFVGRYRGAQALILSTYWAAIGLIAWSAVARGAVAIVPAGAAVAADVVEVANRGLDELSGLAVSRSDDAVLWGHNDTFGGAVLYRIGPSGEDLGALAIAGAHARDWEDIAAFEDHGAPALLIADTGDNLALRVEASLYAVSDPGREGAPALLWRLRFRYPDGARDCEAAAVDMASGEILLVSKRDARPRLYRLPLPRGAPPAVQTAEYLGEVGGLPGTESSGGLLSALLGRFRDSPTALAVSRDGLTAAIVTYRQAYLYRREPATGWAAALAKPVAALPLPAGLDQVEAAELSPDGRELIVGSEGRPARIARIALPH